MAVDSKPFRVAFSAVLKKLREDRGITQLRLAEAAGYEVVYVSNLETGRYQPTLTSLMSLEEALGLAPGELVQRTRRRMTE